MRQPGLVKIVLIPKGEQYVVCVNEDDKEFSVTVTKNQALAILKWASTMGALLDETVYGLSRYQKRAILWGWDTEPDIVEDNAQKMKLNLPKELNIRAEGYYESRQEIQSLCSLAAERIKELEDALDTIADWGMSQPVEMNIPEDRWKEECLRQMQKWAWQAKNGRPLQT